MKASHIFSLYVVAIAALLLTASCNRTFSVQQRHYRNGFYWSGLSYQTKSQFSDTISTVDSTAHDCTTEKPVCESSIGETIIPLTDSAFVVRKDSTTKKLSYGISTVTEIREPQKPDDDNPDRKKITLGFALGLSGDVLMVASLIGLVASPAVFWILFSVAFSCAIAGMIIARRVRMKHIKHEKYPGRWKMIYARLTGIAAILFAVLALTVALASSSQ